MINFIELCNNAARVRELESQNTQLSQELSKAAKLISIDRVGRMIKFTFMRHNKLITIETMGLMSDNTAQWEEELLK